MKIGRLFVPLSKTPFEWFKSGSKTWELRRYGRQYTEKNVIPGRVVELRRGYSKTVDVLWGIVRKVYIFNTVEDVYNDINFRDVIPYAENTHEAIKETSKILKLDRYVNPKFITFNIEIISCPELIPLSEDFFELVKSGIKRTTIRRGHRKYRKGPCILYSENQSELVYINKVEHVPYSTLAIDDAKRDGFQGVNDLAEGLAKFYPDLSANDDVTIVHFDYLRRGEP